VQIKGWLALVSEPVITALDAVALLAILIGTVEVVVAIARFAFSPRSDEVVHEVWLRYARWLVAALTFQLAADIIETSLSSSWETIGRVGAVAVIRTFLNYFLERDLRETRSQLLEEPPPPTAVR
jgi:uncharacterized membrane protein